MRAVLKEEDSDMKFLPTIVEFTTTDFYRSYSKELMIKPTKRNIDSELEKFLRECLTGGSDALSGATKPSGFVSGSEISEQTAEELELDEERKAEAETKGWSDEDAEQYIQSCRDTSPPRAVQRPPVKQYERDVKLSVALKIKYKKCQTGDESFKKDSGEYYLETHHLIPLGKEGTRDHPSNMVVLCPMCHRKLHHGSKEVQLEVLESLKKFSGTAKIVEKLIAKLS